MEVLPVTNVTVTDRTIATCRLRSSGPPANLDVRACDLIRRVIGRSVTALEAIEQLLGAQFQVRNNRAPGQGAKRSPPVLPLEHCWPADQRGSEPSEIRCGFLEIADCRHAIGRTPH